MKKTISLTMVFLACWLNISAKDISLVKHASRPETETAQRYTVKGGDTLWKIFMNVYGANPRDMSGLYNRFRVLNPEIKDLDHINKGQRILVPGLSSTTKVEKIKKVNRETYVIKKGEHLAKVLRQVYHISEDKIFNEYLNQIKTLNPQLHDLDYVVPGQKIRIPGTEKRILDPVKPVKPAKQVKQVKIIKPAKPENPAKIIKPVEPRTSPTRGSTKKIVHPEGVKDAVATSAGDMVISRVVRNTLLPAMEDMGGTNRTKGTYFMPVTGGSSISINTAEIPVVELDTGKKVILDMDKRISPRVKGLIEGSFPSCRIIQGSGQGLEDIMDSILNVSGYFSVNKDANPLLIGKKEKVMLSGKWIVYKDFSRRNVFVINILSKKDTRTPDTIKGYASAFGVDLVEIGGKQETSKELKKDYIRILDHSYVKLFDNLGLSCDKDTEIDLVTDGAVNIAYKAPLLKNRLILTPEMPDKAMIAFLEDKGYRIMDTQKSDVEEVLKALGIKFSGPPFKVQISDDRVEMDIPGIRSGNAVILKKGLDPKIMQYLASTGLDVLIW
ncbi:MAG: LysM peptidoglycan-binding domain-containing protein [Thermodesulfobacteriota bacterium]|nr:LysM peptidoglycan-binding domain-containing protein [Thermodesulfobacteriota bacterium]